MKVNIEKTKNIEPIYEGNIITNPSLLTSNSIIPLSIFDKVTYSAHIAIIYAYHPPTPPNATIELGLKRALSEYKELAGRLGENENGELVIVLNDKGVKLVEGSVDNMLDQIMPLQPSSFLLSLHPSLNDVEELMQVQLTRFSCGSLVIGFTANHLVADGQSISNFLIAWGKATRGLIISPLPLHDRTIFNPREPLIFEFEHRGVEYISKNIKNYLDKCCHNFVDNIIIHKVHFTLEFLSKLKAQASASSNTTNNNMPYTTFESLAAHLWRIITKARGLNNYETTHVRISINGRSRMSPRVSNEYFGNLVLWAFPSSRVEDLVHKPLTHAAKLIQDAITKVDNNYFQSFIDFATHKLDKEKEELIPTAEINKYALCPNLEINSWLKFPFYDLDFGGGSPCIFMPSYLPIEGVLFLLPSFIGDGSIDAFIPLFQDNLSTFKEIIYLLD